MMYCDLEPVRPNFPTKYRCVNCQRETRREFTEPIPERYFQRCTASPQIRTSVLGKAAHYAKDFCTWRAAGSPVRTDEEVERLALVCMGDGRQRKPCEYFRNGTCQHCGCNVRGIKEERADPKSQILGPVYFNAIRMGTKQCPVACKKCGESKWNCICNELKHIWANDSRIRLLLPIPAIHVGGIEYWILALAQYLDPRRFQIVVAAARSHADAVVESMRKYCKVLVGLRAVDHALTKADVVLCWALPNPGALRDTKAEIVFVAHGACDWTTRHIKELAPFVKHRVGVSSDAASMFGNADNTVIHNAVDMSRIEPRASREDIRREWGFTDEDIVVAHIGRIAEDKNPFAVIPACEYLGKPYNAAIIGPVYSGSSKRQMLRLKGRATFIEAVQHVGDALAAIDCLVVASQAEGGPLVALEAMAAGVPLVSTRVGIIRDWTAKHKRVAVTVEPSDTSGPVLGEAIREALSANNRDTIWFAQQLARQRDGATFAKEWTDFLERITKR